MSLTASALRDRAWREANPLRAQARMLRANLHRKGVLIPFEDALTLVSRRGEPCPACGRPTTDIDHDHNTGQVRGLLCHEDNLVLGYVNDDPARLRALAEYVEEEV